MEHHVYLISAKSRDRNGVSHFHNHYNAEYNGEIILKSDVAEFDIARYLLKNKLAEETDKLITYVNGNKSLTGTIKWFAEHTVQENEKVSARFVKWEPFPDRILSTNSPKNAR